MGLTPTTRAAVERVRSAGATSLGQQLNDEVCNFLLITLLKDLNLDSGDLPLPKDAPDFFSAPAIEAPRLPPSNFLANLEAVLSIEPQTETYFLCLAALQKSRMKYEAILRRQPLPTIDQIGPRALLQFGRMSARTLAAFVVWRKWLFDIDNRAAQETGYLFEPIIAHAIGGTPFSASRSPVRRSGDSSKGRQVDCVREGRAYEIKIRVTIAASGQGRWKEELTFPADCRASGYKPVLVVLDPTPNPKLEELVRVFHEHDGETFIGDAAWEHLESAAGPIMGVFLERYVRLPINSTFENYVNTLDPIAFEMTDSEFQVTVGDETVRVGRHAVDEATAEGLPEDVDEELPGV